MGDHSQGLSLHANPDISDHLQGPHHCKPTPAWVTTFKIAPTQRTQGLDTFPSMEWMTMVLIDTFRMSPNYFPHSSLVGM